MPRRSGNIPSLARFGSGNMAVAVPGGKSPRRLQEDDKLTFEETKILELFKRLSVASQNKVLDAMEDWQDEVAEKQLIQNAEEEEKRIKNAKLEAIRADDEKREAAQRLSRASVESGKGFFFFFSSLFSNT